ncbi:MAG: hypothetical protein KL863_05010 [Rhizobium sp.]|nr:hypothetical protein [Rhizobium sp.]
MGRITGIPLNEDSGALCSDFRVGKQAQKDMDISLYDLLPQFFPPLPRGVTPRSDRRDSLRKTCLVVAGLARACAAAVFSAPGRLEAAGLECSLFIDHASGTVLHRHGDCATRVTPMSTFKVPLALMGFDAGILTGPGQPVWQYRAEFNAPERTRKPVDPTIWGAGINPLVFPGIDAKAWASGFPSAM